MSTSIPRASGAYPLPGHPAALAERVCFLQSMPAPRRFCEDLGCHLAKGDDNQTIETGLEIIEITATINIHGIALITDENTTVVIILMEVAIVIPG